MHVLFLKDYQIFQNVKIAPLLQEFSTKSGETDRYNKISNDVVKKNQTRAISAIVIITSAAADGGEWYLRKAAQITTYGVNKKRH